MKSSHMNPYLAGFLLGLVLLITVFVTGRGLGASGAMKSVVATAVPVVAPSHAASNEFYKKATAEGNPMKSWLVFEVLGVVVGGFLSGLMANRLKLQTEHGPQLRPRTRLLFAVIGGGLFGFGAQLARGCTSGAALSGMAVLSTAGFVTMLAIFGSGYVVAYFFRKLWI